MFLWDDGCRWGDTEAEVGKTLREWLIREILHYDYTPTGYTSDDPAAKWVASASLQKSIRRGDALTARRMVDILHDLDPRLFLAPGAGHRAGGYRRL